MELEKLQQMDFFKDQDLAYAFDGLTKVLDREMVLNYARYLIKKKIPFTICLSDVDNFKNVNDGYGHMMGDIVLARFAKHINDIIGDRGVVGRYGGDEFIYVFPKITDYDDVWHVAFDILKSVSKITFENHEEIVLSYTLGLSRFPLNGKTVDDLFELADKALYRGKMKGRNCFIIYLPEKHANIDLKCKRDTINSPLYIHNKIYEFLHGANDLDKSLQNVINYIGSYLMIDHMCIETKDKLKYEYVHPISSKKSGFLKLGYDLIRNTMTNSGIIFENTVLLSKNKKTDKLMMTLEAQSIYSEVLCEIRVKNDVYGYLRCDMVSMDTGRIWQQEDLVTLHLLAIVIGLVMEAKGE